jgi:tetratricopeptide (TPR) repeat protein
LEQYSNVTLATWFKEGRIIGPMHPKRWSNIQDFLVYDPSRVTKPDTLLRQFHLSLLGVDQVGVKDAQLRLTGDTAGVILPPLSQNAKLTASAITDSAPAVGKALKAIMEGRAPDKDELKQIADYLDVPSPIQGNELTLVSARVLLIAGQHSKASSLYQEMLASHLGSRVPLREAAVAYILSGQYQVAERLLIRAVTEDTKQKQIRPSRLGTEQNNLGVLFALQHKVNQSESAFKKAVNLYSEASSLELATVLENLGSLHAASGQFSQAGTEYAQAIQLRTKHGEPDLHLADVMDKYSRALASQNLANEAKDFKSRAEELRANEQGVGKGLIAPTVPPHTVIPAGKPPT